MKTTVPIAIPSNVDAPMADAVVVCGAAAEEQTCAAAHLASLQDSMPEGLASVFVEASRIATRRFWIVDNSSSMMTSDGTMRLAGARGPRYVSCTRWAELRECVLFHAELASRVGTRAEFLLLNAVRAEGAGVKEFSIGLGDQGAELEHARTVMQAPPCGGTPLCGAIREVVRRVRACAAELRARGEQAIVMIASDGEASDGDVRQAMQPLADLPVWSVVRLCTSEDRIIEYWNKVDHDLEQQLEVLDDLSSEATEVRALQPWLTYAEPIQRVREWGAPHIKLFDLLDERRLNPSDIAEMARLVLGGAPLPHPEADPELFLSEVRERLQRAPLVLDPLTKVMKPWLDMRALKRACMPRPALCDIGSGFGPLRPDLLIAAVLVVAFLAHFVLAG